MKKIRSHLILVTILCYSSGAYANDWGQDTIFLHREFYGEDYHRIFIDTSARSVFYDQIADFRFGEFDHQPFGYSLDYIKKHQWKLTRRSLGNLPRKWVILQYYRDQFYAYSPSDWYSHFKVAITDTAFIDFSGEGPAANKIVSYRQLSENSFYFFLKGIDWHARKLVIHIIDRKKGIAVFEDYRSGKKEYYLMIDAAKIRQVPIIVSYCETSKTSEFDFDQPDFEKLLQKKVTNQ